MTAILSRTVFYGVAHGIHVLGTAGKYVHHLSWRGKQLVSSLVRLHNYTKVFHAQWDVNGMLIRGICKIQSKIIRLNCRNIVDDASQIACVEQCRRCMMREVGTQTTGPFVPFYVQVGNTNELGRVGRDRILLVVQFVTPWHSSFHFISYVLATIMLGYAL